MDNDCPSTPQETHELSVRVYAFNEGQKIGFVVGCLLTLLVVAVLMKAAQTYGLSFSF